MSDRAAVELPGIVVTPEWLAAHLDDVVVADVRWYLDGRSGRAAFEGGHIPGAVWVDIDADLSSAHKGGPAGRHPLPDPNDFAAAMGRLGIDGITPVVAYDDSGGGTAGRLWWMLRAQGVPAALLDGGLKAWTGELVGDSAHNRPSQPTWSARGWAPGEVGKAELSAAEVVIDARAAERYRGETEPIDRVPGHIPGAVNFPWGDVLDRETGRFLPGAVLRARFAEVGVTPTSSVVCYCGSGVSACADLVALELAGLPGARLFTPSWSGWAAEPTNPVAIGPATTPTIGPASGPARGPATTPTTGPDQPDGEPGAPGH